MYRKIASYEKTPPHIRQLTVFSISRKFIADFLKIGEKPTMPTATLSANRLNVIELLKNPVELILESLRPQNRCCTPLQIPFNESIRPPDPKSFFHAHFKRE